MALHNHIALTNDLDFIYSCMLYGAKKGHYSFDPSNPELVKWMKLEMRSIVTNHVLIDGRRATSYIYTFNNKRVAVLIICEAIHQSDSIEIYALSVLKQFQKQGIGREIVNNLCTRYIDTDIYARCSSASDAMARLLERSGFRSLSLDDKYNTLVKDAAADIPAYTYTPSILTGTDRTDQNHINNSIQDD